MTRRSALQQAGIGLLGLSGLAPALSGAEAAGQAKAPAAKAAAPGGGDLPPLNRFGRMVQEHYVA
ncbi:MAG: hypothetical protein FJ399_23580, partial [Verrucomicrobia bacterium]|nr:hypothetical protein [Verrucomicrobiota bacterium]